MMWVFLNKGLWRSGQLAAAHPVSGGTYAYGHAFIHPVAGFTAGWMFLAAESASAATAALGCAGYLLHIMGRADAVATRVAVALAIVLGVTALVAGGVRRSNLANVVIVSLTLTSLGAFVVFGWLSVDMARLAERIGGPAGCAGVSGGPVARHGADVRGLYGLRVHRHAG